MQRYEFFSPFIFIICSTFVLAEVSPNMTGESLLEKCDEYEKMRKNNQTRNKLDADDVNKIGKINFCAGYISGVVDQLIAEGLICINNVSFKDIIVSVNTHLRDSQEKLKVHRHDLTRDALIHTFPCQ